VISTARPELLTRRPGWGGGKPNALTLSLAPLSDDDTAQLIGSLLGRAVLEAGRQAALLAHAGGNPLYAEQYVQMLADHRTAGELPVPESVQGIIAARLDLLAPPDKRLLHDAAVIGQVFWPGAVAALGDTPGGGGLEESLHELERKQFIRRERASSLAGEAQYAFVHVLVRDVAYGQIPRAARAGKHAEAAGWIESLGRAEDHAEMLAHHYLKALELARATGQDTTVLVPPARAALQHAGDRAFTLGAIAASAGYYRAGLALWPPEAREERAGLLRLLGTVLFEAGDLSEAEAVLAEGSEVAAAAGASAVQARIRILIAEICNRQGGSSAVALAECEAAIAILGAEGDLEGLAEAWMQAGELRFSLRDTTAAGQALERAIAYARQSGNHRAQMRASHWLAVTYHVLPIPADDAVGRAEQLLQEARGDLWAEADLLKPLCVLYAYVGRTADARAALARTRSIFGGFGAKFALAESGIPAGLMELAIGDPATAERYLREAYEALHAMGERRYLTEITSMLAEALYAQCRFGEAQQMIDEAQALGVPDVGVQASWLGLQAKLHAQRGQFSAAQQLADQAKALISPASSAAERADVLETEAEIHRLAGDRGQAQRCLRAALRIYEDRQATLLAKQVKAALAALASHPETKLA
jgi:tetratricopeptide (TPR) repeat protein